MLALQVFARVYSHVAACFKPCSDRTALEVGRSLLNAEADEATSSPLIAEVQTYSAVSLVRWESCAVCRFARGRSHGQTPLCCYSR